MIPPAQRCIKWMEKRQAWLKRRDCDEGHVGVREDGVEYILDTFEKGRAKEPLEFERALPNSLQQSNSPCPNGWTAQEAGPQKPFQPDDAAWLQEMMAKPVPRRKPARKGK